MAEHLKFDDVGIEKKEFHSSKKSIDISGVDIEKLLVSNEFKKRMQNTSKKRMQNIL